MQWLGTIPKENASTYLAEALRQGVAGFQQGRQQSQQRTLQQQQYGLQKEELGIKKKAVEVDLEKIQYTKRKELVDLLKDSREHVSDDQWQIIVNEPKTSELITSVYGDTGLNAMRALQPKKTRQEDALTAIGKGKPLPGLTMEETKRVAGAMVSPLEAIQSQLGDILSEKGGAGFTVKPPVHPTGPSLLPPARDELVTVTNPSGKRVRIKRSQLQDAFSQGYRK